MAGHLFGFGSGRFVMIDMLLGRRPMRTLILSVALFITLDLSVLVFNFWIAHEVDRDALAINLCGRQRMLTQRMAQLALQTQPSHSAAQHESLRQDLLAAAQQFDHALNALRHGGSVIGGDGRPTQLEAVSDPTARLLLARSAELWPALHNALQPLASTPSGSAAERAALVLATRSLLAHNEALLDLANQLTARLEVASGERTRRLRQVQTLAFVLALLNFIVLLGQVARRYSAAKQTGERLHRLIDSVDAGICLCDARKQIVAANSAATRLLGRPLAALKGQPLNAFVQQHGDVWIGQRPEGQPFYAELRSAHLLEAETELEVLTLHDITERLRQQQHLHELAYHDPLTGLPNRRLFADRIAIAIAQAQRGAQQLGVAMIDLDGFKAINDRDGHAAGDALLVAVARRLQACARAGDTVARLGGDEFVCVFSGISGRPHLHNLGERLGDALRHPNGMDSINHPIKASIGLALFPLDGEEIDELLATADRAMYAVKHSHRCANDAAAGKGTEA